MRISCGNWLPRGTGAYVAVAFAAAAVVSISIKPHLFAGLLGDNIAPELNPGIAAHQITSIWNDDAGLGQDSTGFRPYIFPFLAFDLVFSALGLPGTFSNHFWIYFIAIAQACLTLRLLRTLVPSAHPSAQLFCGLSALLNPYMLFSMHAYFPPTMLSVAVFPGVLAAAIRYWRTAASGALVEFAVWTLFAAADVNEGLILVSSLALAYAGAFFLARHPAAATLRALLVCALIYVGVFSVWWIPIARVTQAQLGALVTSARQYDLQTLQGSSQFTSLGGSVRLVGDYLFANAIGDVPFIAEGSKYEHDAVLVAGTSILPCIAALSLIACRRRWLVAGVMLPAIVAILLVQGTGPPAGNAFLWAFNHVTIWHAFRDPYSKFMWIVALAYSLLAALAINGAFSRWNRNIAIGLAAFAFLGVAAANYPFFVGHMFWPKSYVAVPQRYREMAAWFAARPKGRIVQLPIDPGVFATYDWGYVGDGINTHLIDAPVLSRYADVGLPGNKELDDVLERFRSRLGTRQIGPLLALYGFRYIINDDADNVQFLGPLYADFLDRPVAAMHRAARFESISIYRINPAMVNADIYAASKVISGVHTLTELGVACRLLGSCRDVALAAPTGGISTSYFSFDRRHNAPAGSTNVPERVYSSVPLVSEGKKGTAEALIDYGNRTTGPGSPITGVIYAGKAAVRLHRILPERRSYLKRQIILCPLRYARTGVHLSLPQRFEGTTLLLALRYRSPSSPISLLLSTSSPTTTQMLYTLPRSVVPAYFSRYIAIPGKPARVSIEASARSSSRQSCSDIAMASLSAANLRRSLLLGAPQNFFSTPPYMAMHHDILGAQL